MKTDRPAKKLDYKIIGPFKIKEVYDDAYTLDFPQCIVINPTFHVLLLNKDLEDLLIG